MTATSIMGVPPLPAKNECERIAGGATEQEAGDDRPNDLVRRGLNQLVQFVGEFIDAFDSFVEEIDHIHVCACECEHHPGSTDVFQST